jgi:hypothetical protein
MFTTDTKINAIVGMRSARRKVGKRATRNIRWWKHHGNRISRRRAKTQLRTGHSRGRVRRAVTSWDID